MTVEAPAITEITMSGPGRRRRRRPRPRCSATWSRSSPARPRCTSRASELDVVRDVSSSFYLHLEVADRPGVLARIADVLGDNEISVKSVVQRGLGDDARLVMVMHECPEARFYAALEEIAELDFLRAPPRAIRVIEEEFV